MVNVGSEGFTSIAVLGGAPIAAAALSAAIVWISLPWFRSVAMAVPNARSSHRVPTPQGGGLAVTFSTFLTVWCAAGLTGALSTGGIAQLSMVTVAAALLAIIGLIDDLGDLSQLTRLIVQCVAVTLILIALPTDARVFSALPLWLERALTLIAGVWYINVVNFMDGIDWITVAEVVPVSAAIVTFGVIGILPPLTMLLALALLGAIVGFAPFNKPLARIFLGDVGSLPIGLVSGWLLLNLAFSGHLIAALLLPFYYLADSTLTLLRRIIRREPFWRAHRSHFYQRAVDGGYTVPAVVARIFGLNVLLAALALLSMVVTSNYVLALLLVIGLTLTAILLRQFSQGAK